LCAVRGISGAASLDVAVSFPRLRHWYVYQDALRCYAAPLAWRHCLHRLPPPLRRGRQQLRAPFARCMRLPHARLPARHSMRSSKLLRDALALPFIGGRRRATGNAYHALAWHPRGVTASGLHGAR
jgi:hypothetical protein